MVMWSRLILGVLAGVAVLPFAGAVLQLIEGLATYRTFDANRITGSLSAGFFTGLLAVPIGFAALLLYALPMFLALRRFGKASLFACVVCALLPGFALATLEREVWPIFAVGLFALPAALAFWVFARKVCVHAATSGLS
jgi:threonine/homoserine efflux transporter RhtA